MDCIQHIDVDCTASGAWRLRWDHAFTPGPVSVSYGLSPDTINSPPLATNVREVADVRLPAPCVRPYFRLTAGDGTGVVVAERRLPLDGGVNFRDLGGYQVADGRRVKWGQLFRSGHLSRLTDTDQARLGEFGLRTVCDFRMEEERITENVTLSCSPNLTTLGIPPGIKDRHFLHRLFEETDDPAVVVAAMHDIMRSLVEEAAPRYARLFEVLLDAPPGAVLMNCSAGKERTGVGAALLLLALGAPRATAMYDFTLSRRYFPAEAELPRAREKYSVQPRPGRDVAALMAPLLVTRESYLQTVFDVIDRQYGSDDAFLDKALGLGASARAQLRDRYTC